MYWLCFSKGSNVTEGLSDSSWHDQLSCMDTESEFAFAKAGLRFMFVCRHMFIGMSNLWHFLQLWEVFF